CIVHLQPPLLHHWLPLVIDHQCSFSTSLFYFITGSHSYTARLRVAGAPHAITAFGLVLPRGVPYHSMVHPHLFCLGELPSCFSRFLSTCGGRTTTCIVITPPGTSPIVTRDSASVRLFSNIFPPLMSFRSLTVFGVISLSCGHRARMKSLSAETVVAGSYLLGPMSVPSKSRNLTSIGSFPPAISRPAHRPPPATHLLPPKIRERPRIRSPWRRKGRTEATQIGPGSDSSEEFLLSPEGG
uniref:Uncharacterized protein n=2 Tax=Aegilops tauschii subsp. strangulata TaxID=200361 RepID=A0A453PJE2_AEGTS